eukprot:608797_1
MSNGQCWEKGCTDDTDCPSAYVCKDRGGWSTCAVDCASNDTYCAETNNGDTSFKCQVNGVCEQELCTDHTECGSGSRCNAFGNCVPECQNNYDCEMNHGYPWQCGVDSYCVYRECLNDTDCINNRGTYYTCNETNADYWQCTRPYCNDDNDCEVGQLCYDYMGENYCRAGCSNDTDCYNIFYGMKPICDTATSTCHEESCVNNQDPDYCFTQYGMGQACNTTSGHCEYAYCMQDSDCASNVCMWGMDCAPSCIGRASRWCANAFQNEHYSCNTTNGHCWERPCDIALNDCPTDYVCKEEYGWAHCMIGCVNDTECAQDNNYDESFKCQGNGLCERDTCADPVDCTESGYTCSQFNECVPGCQNNYDCEMNHGSPEWQCGVDSYCVYRECLNDTICINNRGTYYTCNKTNDDYWQCTRPYCNDDNDCEVGQLCDNYMGDNYCRAGCSNDTDCDYIFYGMKP